MTKVKVYEKEENEDKYKHHNMGNYSLISNKLSESANLKEFDQIFDSDNKLSEENYTKNESNNEINKLFNNIKIENNEPNTITPPLKDLSPIPQKDLKLNNNEKVSQIERFSNKNTINTKMNEKSDKNTINIKKESPNKASFPTMKNEVVNSSN